MSDLPLPARRPSAPFVGAPGQSAPGNSGLGEWWVRPLSLSHTPGQSVYIS